MLKKLTTEEIYEYYTSAKSTEKNNTDKSDEYLQGFSDKVDFLLFKEGEEGFGDKDARPEYWQGGMDAAQSLFGLKDNYSTDDIQKLFERIQYAKHVFTILKKYKSESDGEEVEAEPTNRQRPNHP